MVTMLHAGLWFLPKVFSQSDLLAKVREVLDASPDSPKSQKENRKRRTSGARRIHPAHPAIPRRDSGQSGITQGWSTIQKSSRNTLTAKVFPSTKMSGKPDGRRNTSSKSTCRRLVSLPPLARALAEVRLTVTFRVLSRKIHLSQGFAVPRCAPCWLPR